MKTKILCIEDDITIQTLVAQSLQEFDVVAATDMRDAETHLKNSSFDAIIIDICLPDGDGLRLLTQLAQRKDLARVPILILSGYNDISNKVMAFNYGAEDFISKPFDPIEFHARVTAKLKRRSSEMEDLRIRRLGDVVVDFDKQKVFVDVDGSLKDLNFTSIEMKIISLLTKRLEQVHSREQLLDSIWGSTYIADRTVDSHIAHLRRKIEHTKLAIETAKNFGYRAVLRG